MIEIYSVTNEDYRETIKKSAKVSLDYLGIKERDVTIEITFVSQEYIKNLNRKYRDIDEDTDILSFANIKQRYPYDFAEHYSLINPEDNSLLLGEIFINLNNVQKRAKEYNSTTIQELRFLTIHGILHLLGYTHLKKEDEDEMHKLQGEIMEKITKSNEKKEKFKSGFVAVMGRANAGKSTLVNTLVGEKVSIVSWKPQTTRDRILGIYNDENTQIVFIDTPGLHSPKNVLGKYMMRTARAALDGVDIVVYIIDGEKGIDNMDKRNISSYISKGYKIIITVNKVDRITHERMFEILAELKEFTEAEAIMPMSALRGRNTDTLLKELRKLLTEDIKFFSDDMFTDKNMRFMVAEIIREKALRLLEQEIPYGVGIVITLYEYRKNGDILYIDADILCEKPAHRPIILGKGGTMIKKIATYARQDIEALVGKKVFLSVFVRVSEGWRNKENIIKELGYN